MTWQVAIGYPTARTLAVSFVDSFYIYIMWTHFHLQVKQKKKEYYCYYSNFLYCDGCTYGPGISVVYLITSNHIILWSKDHERK